MVSAATFQAVPTAAPAAPFVSAKGSAAAAGPDGGGGFADVLQGWQSSRAADSDATPGRASMASGNKGTSGAGSYLTGSNQPTRAGQPDSAADGAAAQADAEDAQSKVTGGGATSGKRGEAASRGSASATGTTQGKQVSASAPWQKTATTKPAASQTAAGTVSDEEAVSNAASQYLAAETEQSAVTIGQSPTVSVMVATTDNGSKPAPGIEGKGKEAAKESRKKSEDSQGATTEDSTTVASAPAALAGATILVAGAVNAATAAMPDTEEQIRTAASATAVSNGQKAAASSPATVEGPPASGAGNTQVQASSAQPGNGFPVPATATGQELSTTASTLGSRSGTAEPSQAAAFVATPLRGTSLQGAKQQTTAQPGGASTTVSGQSASQNGGEQQTTAAAAGASGTGASSAASAASAANQAQGAPQTQSPQQQPATAGGDAAGTFTILTVKPDDQKQVAQSAGDKGSKETAPAHRSQVSGSDGTRSGTVQTVTAGGNGAATVTVTINQQQPQAKAEPTDAATAAGQGTGKKDAVAQAGKGNLAGGKAADEQVAAPPKGATGETTGSKGATTAQAGKPAAAQGNPGQDAPTAGKEHPEQKAQGNQTQQALNTAFGMQPQQNTESAQPAAKAAPAQSELHQSILAQVKDGVVIHDAKGNGQMTIRLNPDQLGELKIQVRMDDANGVKIEVHATNSSVKDLLMSNLDSLKEALSGKNFTMEGFDVSTGGGGFNGSLPDQQGNPQQQSTPRFARSGGYGQSQPTVKYVTDEADNLLDVRL